MDFVFVDFICVDDLIKIYILLYFTDLSAEQYSIATSFVI